MRNAKHEIALIKTFLLPGRRDRAIAQLNSTKKRSQFLNRLAHLNYLDERFAHRIPDDKQSVDAIFAELKSRGAPKLCYLISEWKELDGRELPLFDALSQIVGSGMGTLISSLPGELGYYEGEDMGERYILTRNH